MLDAGAARIVCLVKEDIYDEVDGFAQYWPGEIMLDSDLSFFRAIAGGQVWNCLFGMLANLVIAPISCSLVIMTNFLYWWNSGVAMNLKGEGFIGGGWMVLGKDGSLQYSFQERIAGDRPVLADVVAAVKAAVGNHGATSMNA